MTLFIIGILEMIIVTTWTKAVANTQVVISAVVTFVHIMIWYYVIRSLTSDINNWSIALWYASGCTIGTLLCTWYFQWRENRAKK